MKPSLTLAASCALAAAAAVPFPISWQVRRPLPFGIAGGVAAYLDNALIYAGGTTWRGGEKIWLASVHRYDVAQDAWSESTDLPEALAYGPSVGSGDAVEIFGGMTGSGPSFKCWRLRKGETVWQHTGDVPAATALGRAATIRGRTYLFGGCPDVADLSGCSDSVKVRSEKGVWETMSKFPSGPIALAASAVIDDYVYLFGGCASTGPGTIHNLDEGWKFAPAEGRWHKLRSLPMAIRALSATGLDDERILLAGGYYGSQDEAKLHGPEYGFSKAVWIYHIRRDEYEPVTALPEAVAGLEITQGHRQIFLIGGEDRARSRSRSMLEARLP